MKALHLCIIIGLLHLIGAQNTIPRHTRLFTDSINHFNVQDISANNNVNGNLLAPPSPHSFDQFRVITLSSRGDHSPDLSGNILNTIADGMGQPRFNSNNARSQISSQSPRNRFVSDVESRFTNTQVNAAAERSTFPHESRSFANQNQLSVALDEQTNNVFLPFDGSLTTRDNRQFGIRDEITPTRNFRDKQVKDTDINFININSVQPNARKSSRPNSDTRLAFFRSSRVKGDSRRSRKNTESLFRAEHAKSENDIIAKTQVPQSSRRTSDSAALPFIRFQNDRISDDINQFRAADRSALNNLWDVNDRGVSLDDHMLSDTVENLPSTDDRRQKRIVSGANDILNSRSLFDRQLLLSTDDRRQQRIVSRKNDIIDSRSVSDRNFLTSTVDSRQQRIMPQANDFQDKRSLSDRDFLSSTDGRQQQRIVLRTNDIVDRRPPSDRGFSRREGLAAPRDVFRSSVRRQRTSKDRFPGERLLKRNSHSDGQSNKDDVNQRSNRRLNLALPIDRDTLSRKDNQVRNDDFVGERRSRLQNSGIDSRELSLTSRMSQDTNAAKFDNSIVSGSQPQARSDRLQQINDLLSEGQLADVLEELSKVRRQSQSPERNSFTSSAQGVFPTSSINGRFSSRRNNQIHSLSQEDDILIPDAGHSSFGSSHLSVPDELLSEPFSTRQRKTTELIDRSSQMPGRSREPPTSSFNDVHHNAGNTTEENKSINTFIIFVNSELASGAKPAGKPSTSQVPETGSNVDFSQLSSLNNNDLTALGFTPGLVGGTLNNLSNAPNHMFVENVVASGMNNQNFGQPQHGVGQNNAGSNPSQVIEQNTLGFDPMTQINPNMNNPFRGFSNNNRGGLNNQFAPNMGQILDPQHMNQREQFANEGNLFGIQDNQFGNEGNPFGNQGSRFGNHDNSFGSQGNLFDDQSSPFGNLDNQFGSQGNPFGNQGNPFGNQGNPFVIQGNPFDNQVNPFDNQVNPFDNQGNPFDNQGNLFDNQGNPFDNQVNPFDNQGNLFDNQGNLFDNQVNPFDNQGNPFDNQGNPFDNQGNLFGNQDNQLGSQGNPFGNQDNQFGNQGNPFGMQDNPFINEENQIGGQGNPFNNQGNPFGSQGNDFGNQGNPFGNEGNPFGNEGNLFSNVDNQFGNQDNPFGNPGNFQNFQDQDRRFIGENNQQPFLISSDFDGDLLQQDMFIDSFSNPMEFEVLPGPMMPGNLNGGG